MRGDADRLQDILEAIASIQRRTPDPTHRGHRRTRTVQGRSERQWVEGVPSEVRTVRL